MTSHLLYKKNKFTQDFVIVMLCTNMCTHMYVQSRRMYFHFMADCNVVVFLPIFGHFSSWLNINVLKAVQ